MNEKRKSAISPTREENYAEWYQQVVEAAELAEHSPVRGCMVIRPWGFGIWENIQRILDHKIKETGHQNAYFPLLIPLSFFEREAQHVEGFAKECAVVTHHRLEKDEKGKLVPSEKLEEPLVVRPTSEMIVGETFSKWVQSYRDLPLLINQWANIVRWEMRTRMFLRTTEFLWQEGHTVHATEKEALDETMKMLNVYKNFCEDVLAMPVICGEKTEEERFPGAVSTFSVEAMMQDGKALQAGTSHFLGQNFSRVCQIRFCDEKGSEQYGWTTSWGVTTRLIGGMVMTHSDDDGIILPPKVATKQIVLLPIIHKPEMRGDVLDYCHKLAQELRNIAYHGKPLEIVVDEREMRGGEKKWSWVKKGVPLLIEIGPRDIAENSFSLLWRDCLEEKGRKYSREEFVGIVTKELDKMQKSLLQKAKIFQETHTEKITSLEDFYDFFSTEKKKGFALCHWNPEAKIEKKIKEDLGVSIRAIPLEEEEERGLCIFSKKVSKKRVIFAKAY